MGRGLRGMAAYGCQSVQQRKKVEASNECEWKRGTYSRASYLIRWPVYVHRDRARGLSIALSRRLLRATHKYAIAVNHASVSQGTPAIRTACCTPVPRCPSTHPMATRAPNVGLSEPAI